MSRIPTHLSACLAAAALFLPSAASAQETEKPAPQEKVVPQDADVPEPPAPDPAQVAKNQLKQIGRELEFVEKIRSKGGLIQRVESKMLSNRSPSPRSFDLGVDVVQPVRTAAQPKTPQPAIRLFGDEERERYDEGVVFAVNGQPVTQAEYQAMFDYMNESPAGRSEEQIAKEAVRALVMQKAALARFSAKAPTAREQIEAIEAELGSGGDFAAVARTKSMCPSAAQGGDLGFFTKGRMDPMFERVAFETKVGETSDVVQSAFGYHLIKVTAREEGEGDQPTRVRASHILVSFDENSQVVREVMTQAANGQVDLAFVDADWRKKSPF